MKIVENKVPNFSHHNNGNEIGGISWYHHIWLERKCQIPNIETGPFQQTRNLSLARKGPALFNCLPKPLRDTSNCSTDSFKVKLEKWLTNIPDEPQIPGYSGMRRRNTNSITDMQSIGLFEMDA